MTERQRNELERQFNDYSYQMRKFKSIGADELSKNTISKLIALRDGLVVLGYRFLYDGNREKNGIEYESYILREKK